MENLRLRCPYFYDVALLLHSIERGPSLAEFAMKTFQARYKVKFHPNCTSACHDCWKPWHALAHGTSKAHALFAMLTSTADHQAGSSPLGYAGLA